MNPRKWCIEGCGRETMEEPQGHLPLWEQLALVVGLVAVSLLFMVWVVALYFAMTPAGG